MAEWKALTLRRAMARMRRAIILKPWKSTALGWSPIALRLAVAHYSRPARGPAVLLFCYCDTVASATLCVLCAIRYVATAA